MKSLYKVLALITCLVLAGPNFSQAQEAARQSIQELFLNSGIEQLTQQMPVLFEQGIEQAYAQDSNLKSLPKHLVSELKQASAKAYAAGKTQAVMAKSISGKMTDSDIRLVLKWLDSPIGKKCTELETYSVTAEGLNAMAQFVQQLQNNPPPASRLKLIEELDGATNATATSVEAFVNTHLAVSMAVALSIPAEKRKPISQIKKELDQNRAAIEKALQQHILVSMLFTYRTISDADLRQYIDFALSPIGVKYHKTTIEAFQQALIECGADFGQAAGKAYESINKKSET